MTVPRILAALAAGSVVVVPVALGLAPGTATAHPFDIRHLPRIQHRLMSNALTSRLGEGDDDRNADAEKTKPPLNYFPVDSDGCPVFRFGNVKVNQNCLNLTDPDLQGRGQSQNETSIAADPANGNHLVASYNDYRRGDGNCYSSYSKDAGRHWEDSTVPMSFTRGTNFNNAQRQYWEAGGDTSVAYDTKGNAYLSCQVFNRGSAGGLQGNTDVSSAFYVFRSTRNAGASWNFPARPVAESYNPAGAGAIVLEDKQLLTVDNHRGSPYQDRVYVTWTEFNANGTAYIYSAYSKDYGEHFSKQVLVSRTSAALCSNTYGLPTPQGTCNENQFSQPITGSDGALYVTYANFNNAQSGSDNHNQMLLAKSTDGGRTFSAPVKAGDYYDLPDCSTYQGGQDPGRACVPEKGKTANSVFRATNYPVAAVDPKNARHVVVTYGSYINRNSKEGNGCRPDGLQADFGTNLYTGVKTAGACNNDILTSVSSDGGRSFTGTTTDPRRMPVATPTGRQARTDQWFQWAAYGPDGRFAVSYYDRQYGHDEMNGYSDYSVSGSRDLTSFRVTRATSGSLPPPTSFGGVFWGDYTGLAVTATGAYPLWVDTRDPDLFLCPGTGTAGSAPKVCGGIEANGLKAADDNVYTTRVAHFS